MAFMIAACSGQWRGGVPLWSTSYLWSFLGVKKKGCHGSMHLVQLLQRIDWR